MPCGSLHQVKWGTSFESQGDERSAQRVRTKTSKTCLAEPPFDDEVNGAVRDAAQSIEPPALPNMGEDGCVVPEPLAGSGAGTKPVLDEPSDVRWQLHRSHHVALA